MKKLLMGMLLTAMVVSLVPAVGADAATKKIATNNKKYSVDLDGDGKKEIVTWKKEESNTIDYYYRYAVSVDGESAFKTGYGLSVELFVGDMDKKGKKKGLLTIVTSESEGLEEIAAYRYGSEKTTKVFREKSKDLGSLNLYRLDGGTVKLMGGGKVALGAEAFDIRIQKPYKADEIVGIGQYFEQRIYEIKGKHLKDVTGPDREVLYAPTYTVTAPVNVCSDIEGTNVALTLNQGDTFVVKKAHYDSSNKILTHIYVEGSAGAGWIAIPDMPFIDSNGHLWG